MPCHQSFLRQQGARRLISKPCQRSYGNRVEEMLDAASCTCISDSECLFGSLVAALFVLLVLSSNVFVSKVKPSDCKPNPLETHQLYSRLISCTRKISILHLEFKCVFGCVCVCVRICVSVSVFVCNLFGYAHRCSFLWSVPMFCSGFRLMVGWTTAVARDLALTSGTSRLRTA